MVLDMVKKTKYGYEPDIKIEKDIKEIEEETWKKNPEKELRQKMDEVDEVKEETSTSKKSSNSHLIKHSSTKRWQRPRWRI